MGLRFKVKKMQFRPLKKERSFAFNSLRHIVLTQEKYVEDFSIGSSLKSKMC